jgi:hypothetical protein
MPGGSLAISVTAALIATLLPLLVLSPQAAAAPTGLSAGDTTTTPSPSPEPPSDDVPELRTQYSRAWVDTDGVVERTIYPQPINFRADDGSWAPIDSTLVDSDRPGYAAQNAANGFEVFIPNDVDSMPVRVQDDAGWLTFTPVAAQGSPDVRGESATFDGPTATTDFMYQVDPTGVKETVQLATAPAVAPTYRYTMTLATGLTPTLTDDGAVVINDAVGNAAYTIPAPFMSDASGTEAGTSTQVATILDATTNGWTLSITPNFAWLSDPARVYPVSVDPTVVVDHTGTNFQDCWIKEAAPTSTFCGSTSDYIWVGKDATGERRRGLVKFDLTNVPGNARISSATLKLYLDHTQSRTGIATTYAARQVIPAWTESATWNKRNSTTAWATPGLGAGSDYLSSSVTGPTLGGATDGYKDFDVTAVVANWKGNPSNDPNNGLVIRQSTEADNELAFFSGDSADTSKMPLLELRYTVPPTTPTGLGVSPCVGACSQGVTSSLTPTLSATSTDADGGSLTYTFTVTTPGGSVVASGTAQATQGNAASWPVPAGKLADDSSYKFTVSAFDGTPPATIAADATFNFTTNTDKAPATPTAFTEAPCKPALCADAVPAGTPPTLMSVSPTLTATLSDPDTGLGSLYGDFQVRAVGTTTNLAVGSAQPNTTTGVAAFTVPAGLLSDGGHYEFRVGDRDATSTTWSGWIGFDVAVNKVATVPAVVMTPCTGSCGTWTTDTTVPTFTTTATDADDSNITYYFQLQKPDGSVIATQEVKGVQSGDPAHWLIPVGKIGPGTYQIQVGAADDTQASSSQATWAAPQPFVVQTPTPNPTVSGQWCLGFPS